MQHYHHFGDLLKMALARCREAQPIQWYKTIALSLQQVFLRLSEEGGGKVDLTDPQWVELRDLARRYSLPFSFDQFKATSRQMLVGIHRSAQSIITHKCTLISIHTHTHTHTYTQCLVLVIIHVCMHIQFRPLSLYVHLAGKVSALFCRPDQMTMSLEPHLPILTS